MSNKKILLHSCCAPCIAYVQELLSEGYIVTAFYYNPNIAPIEEYQRRFAELSGYSDKIGIDIIEGEYDTGDWTSEVKEFRFLGERSERCARCFTFRLKKAFMKAEEMGIDIVASTLSISPHKDTEMINSAGKILEAATGIEFLAANFKKNDGYKKSVEISSQQGFYRQNYCGCIYSKMERNMNSIWMRKIGKKHRKAF